HCPAHGRRADCASPVRQSLSSDPVLSRHPVVSAACRRILQDQRLALRELQDWRIAGFYEVSTVLKHHKIMPTPFDLELSADHMRAMAAAVIARSVDHIAGVDGQPSSGDVNAAEVCRTMRE